MKRGSEVGQAISRDELVMKLWRELTMLMVTTQQNSRSVSSRLGAVPRQPALTQACFFLIAGAKRLFAVRSRPLLTDTSETIDGSCSWMIRRRAQRQGSRGCLAQDGSKGQRPGIPALKSKRLGLYHTAVLLLSWPACRTSLPLRYPCG